MPGGERDEQRVDVVLEDAVAADGVEPPPEGPARRHRRWPLWAGAAVVVVALAATSAVLTAEDERRDDDRREALADVPGLLPRLDGPLEELWHVSGDGWPLAVGRDVVVMMDEAGDGRLLAVDLRTGQEAWTRPMSDDEVCVALSDDASPSSPTSSGDVAERIACHRSFATVEGYRVVVGEPASVEVLDVTTGAVVVVVPTPADVLGVEQAGGDVVVASLDTAGAVVLSRWAPGPTSSAPTGPVWSTQLPEPLESIDEAGWVFHAEAEVVRAGTVGSVPLDLATGEPRPDAARPGVLFTDDAPLPGGGRVEWDYDHVATTTGTSRVVRPDDEDVVEVDGVPWLPWVADDSSPDVLLLRRATSVLETGQFAGELVAVDATTGADLWSGGRMAGLEALVRLEDVVVAAGAGRVVALDVRDGEVVWEDRRSGASPRFGGLTDGEVVLVGETAGAEPAMVARDVRTGVERWRVPLADLLPGDDQQLLVPTVAGVLVLRWDGAVTMLAPAR